MTVSASAIIGVLHRWLVRQLPADAAGWLVDMAERVAASDSERELFLAVSLVPRRVGKQDLQLSQSDLADADAVRAGWDPRDWSTDQAARLLLLLRTAGTTPFAERLERLFVTSDLGELVTFYRGLPLYPDPETLVTRAAEGARSNIKAVFEAVAHRNPYPAEHFTEATWNQLVLKALFVGSRLDPIQRLDDRQNASLARMLCDYAHERWAASRRVSPELWRCVGRFADESAIADLAHVLKAGDAREQAAAMLALSACPRPEARTPEATYRPLAEQVASGIVTWVSLAEGPTS